MPPRGWKKWTLYEFEGRKVQNPDQVVQALRHLRIWRSTEFKLVKVKGGYKVYHGWN